MEVPLARRSGMDSPDQLGSKVSGWLELPLQQQDGLYGDLSRPARGNPPGLQRSRALPLAVVRAHQRTSAALAEGDVLALATRDGSERVPMESQRA